MIFKRSELIEAYEEANKIGDVEKRYWSCFPGNWVSPRTGALLEESTKTISLREWYETLHVRIASLALDLTNEDTQVDLYVAPEGLAIMEQSIGFTSPIVFPQKYNDLEEYALMGKLYQKRVYSNFYHWTSHVFVVTENINAKIGVILTDIGGNTPIGKKK